MGHYGTKSNWCSNGNFENENGSFVNMNQNFSVRW
jgi:hypothetical protein